MITIPKSKSFDANERKYGQNDGSACIVCSKPVAAPTTWVRIYAGSYICTAAEAEANPDADTGYYPVGPECLHKHPQMKEYVRPTPAP